MSEFLNQEKGFPHCPGCGHPHVLRSLDHALQKIERPKDRMVLVTDIGCVGLSDAYFPTMHTVHTLHGRSSAIASGIQMGADVSKESPLKVIVLVGDGGAGIGLLHLVHAAQMNVDVTVLIHNNLIYGMTGGQHSVLTPQGLKTTTTPLGSEIPPLDLGALLMGAGTGFFARTVAPGEHLDEYLFKAIDHPGFACVEIFELCPTFATKLGGVTGKTLKNLPAELGRELGILRENKERPPFHVMNSEAVRKRKASSTSVPADSNGSDFSGTLQMILGGRAGERAQSAAMLTARAALSAGLYATVRSDNPVTQGSGFSLAELTISSDPIDFTGMSRPDVVLVTAEESLSQIRQRGLFDQRNLRLVIDASLSDDHPNTQKADFRKRFGPKDAALGSLMLEVTDRHLWQVESWRKAIDTLPEARKASPKRS